MSRSWLDDKNILIVSKPLALAAGLHASIALRRVKSWLNYNEDHKQKQEATHFRDGRWWTRNGYQGWVDDLEIMSYSTVRRTFTELEKLRLLISTHKYNANEKDLTKWWSIDYENFDAFVALWQEMGSPAFREGSQQSAGYRAFLMQWHLRLAAAQVVIPMWRTLLTMNRVDDAPDPAHDEQAPLLTVTGDTLFTMDRPPAHGEQAHPIESHNQSLSDESSVSIKDDDDDPQFRLIQATWKAIKASNDIQADGPVIRAAIAQFGAGRVLSALARCEAAKGQTIRSWAYIDAALRDDEKQADKSPTAAHQRYTDGKDKAFVNRRLDPQYEQKVLQAFYGCVADVDLLGALTQTQILRMQFGNGYGDWPEIVNEAIRGDRRRLDGLLKNNQAPHEPEPERQRDTTTLAEALV